MGRTRSSQLLNDSLGSPPPTSYERFMSTKYYGPDEPADDVYLERTFLAGDFITGVGYGFQAALFINCAKLLYSRYSKSQRSASYPLFKKDGKALFLLFYVTLLFAIETLYAVIQAQTIQSMYIDNRNYPGGPWAYFLATRNVLLNEIFYGSLFILTFLVDLLLLRRCWVIWTASGGRLIPSIVIALPALLVFASFVMVMGTLWNLKSYSQGFTLYSALPMAYGTAYYAISPAANMLLTILITARLLFYRRRAKKYLRWEQISEYFSLSTILIESAALNSIFALVFVITFAIDHSLNQVFLGVASSAQQIAGYLIISRLAQNRAWNSTTLESGGSGSTLLQFDAHSSVGDYSRPVSQSFRQSSVMEGFRQSSVMEEDPRLTAYRPYSGSSAFLNATSRSQLSLHG